MARPIKEGLDYFPHDVDAVNDEKIEALRMLFGNNGYAFYFILLERIYRTNTLELDISEEETIQILSRKIGISEDEFERILKSALKYGCFDGEIYENKKCLTSNGIKKRASVVIEKRAKMQEHYKNKQVIVSDAETLPETIQEIPPETTQETLPETIQRKEKDRKEKNSKEDNEYNDFFESVWKLYPFKRGKERVSEKQKKKLYKLGLEQITACINQYIEDVEGRRKNGFKGLNFKNGDTFFNSGYLDYLDENYESKENKKIVVTEELAKLYQEMREG